jgi:hypothetical protein
MREKDPRYVEIPCPNDFICGINSSFERKAGKRNNSVQQDHENFDV